MYNTIKGLNFKWLVGWCLVAIFDLRERALKEHISINCQPFNKAAQDGEV